MAVARRQKKAALPEVEERLDTVAEAEWKRLRRQIELTNEFWLAFLFTASADKARVLRRRAAQMLEREGRSFVLLEPATPQELASLSGVLLGPDMADTQCVWVEALEEDAAGLTSSPWGMAWNELVLRLNERRDSLRRHLPGGLVFAGPSEIKPHIRDMAPDLWSVRSLVLDLFEQTAELPPVEITAPPVRIMDLDGFVTANPKMQQILETAGAVAMSDVPILVEGETGTGKSLIVRFIHTHSRKAKYPFVEVNCGSIPEPLIHTELFGHERGAFTGANLKRGLFEAVSGGTLVLDQVSDLSTSAQAALLGTIESRAVRRVGGTNEIRVDVRVICTTNRNLEAMIAAGTFREDVFFRLGFRLKIPPLRERPEDTRPVAERLLTKHLSNNGLGTQLSLSESALLSLEQYSWPGNVRELATIIEVAAIRATADGSPQIERRHVFPDEPGSDSRSHFDDGLSLAEATRRFQEQLIRRTLKATDWSISEAAGRLGVTRRQVYHFMQAFQIERPRR